MPQWLKKTAKKFDIAAKLGKGEDEQKILVAAIAKLARKDASVERWINSN